MCDYPKAYTSEDRISRKPHECAECGGRIFYKEKYNYFTAIWDNSWGTFKTCMDCVELRKEYEGGLTRDDGICVGGLYESIVDDGNKYFVQKMVDIQDKRGKLVRPWIRKYLRECK